jgi:8-oxo-dGTP diphosphatase
VSSPHKNIPKRISNFYTPFKNRLKKMYTYEYPRPALTVDCIIFGLDKESLKVLLIERADEPYKHHWALPGGFVEMDESIERAAQRELEEETGLKDMFMEQLYTFGTPNRDPRGRVISVAYFALVKMESCKIMAGSDARKVEWQSINSLPPLAFDHAEIFAKAFERLKNKVRYQPIGFELLPEKFTLGELQTMYEAILNQTLDKRNFRKKILSTNLLKDVQERQKGVPHRAAKLFQFDKEAYRELALKGFIFEL